MCSEEDYSRFYRASNYNGRREKKERIAQGHNRKVNAGQSCLDMIWKLHCSLDSMCQSRKRNMGRCWGHFERQVNLQTFPAAFSLEKWKKKVLNHWCIILPVGCIEQCQKTSSFGIDGLWWMDYNCFVLDSWQCNSFREEKCHNQICWFVYLFMHLYGHPLKVSIQKIISPWLINIK